MAIFGRAFPIRPWISKKPVSAAATQTLTPSLFSDADTFYSATVTPGTVTLTPSLFSDADTFRTPTVTAGVVTLTSSLFTDADTFYRPIVTGGGTVAVGGGAGEPHTFTRKRWEELRKALHDARHKALTDERKKKREALDRAADAAAHALAIVRKEEEDLTRATIAKMGAMTRALEAATSAVKLTTALRSANTVVTLAKTIERQIEDEEDEDDAVMLLLS